MFVLPTRWPGGARGASRRGERCLPRHWKLPVWYSESEDVVVAVTL
jgi:hypothetical protein